MWRQLGQRSQDGSRRQVRECLCGSGFSRLCVNGWAVSVRVLRREPRGPHPDPFNRDVVASSWTCWCGSGHRAIHDDPLAWLWVHSLLPRGSADLQRIAVCSTPSSERTPSPCDHEALLTTLTTRRFSWRTTGSALASPCLLSLRFCRQPERGAVLQHQQRVPHRLLQCDEPSLHRAHPRLLQEGTTRSAVPSDRARGVWRCKPCRCAAAMIC